VSLQGKKVNDFGQKCGKKYPSDLFLTHFTPIVAQRRTIVANVGKGLKKGAGFRIMITLLKAT
jgi:hypothetical protein